MNKTKFIPAYLLTFVNVLGFSILIPVLPFIIEQYEAPQYVYGLLLSLYSAFQFIGSPFLGKMSDDSGRKPILLISQIGTLLSWVIFGIAYFLPSNINFIYALPIWIIAFSRILDGITGGNTSVTNAYISDITNQKEKVTIFGYMGGIVGIGIIVGPVIGGFAASSSYEYLGVIIIAFIISAITVLAIQFFLKESLVKSELHKKPKTRLSFLDVILVTRRIRKLNPSKFVKHVFLLKFIMSIAMASYIGTFALYLIDLFAFDEKEMGFFMLGAGIFLSFNQVFVYKRIVRKLGELKTLTLGFLLITLGFIAITLTDDFITYFILYFILNLGMSLSMPVFNSIISQKVSSENQGEAMGISESIRSICNAIFPVIAAYLYSILFYKFYYILALLTLIGFYYSFRIVKRSSFNIKNNRDLKP